MVTKNQSHNRILQVFQDSGCPVYTVYSDIIDPVTVSPECSTIDNLGWALKDRYINAISFDVNGTTQKFDLHEEDCGLKIH